MKHLRHIAGIDDADLTTAEKQIKNGADPITVLADISWSDMTDSEKKIYKEACNTDKYRPA